MAQTIKPAPIHVKTTEEVINKIEAMITDAGLDMESASEAVSELLEDVLSDSPDVNEIDPFSSLQAVRYNFQSAF